MEASHPGSELTRPEASLDEEAVVLVVPSFGGYCEAAVRSRGGGCKLLGCFNARRPFIIDSFIMDMPWAGLAASTKNSMSVI